MIFLNDSVRELNRIGPKTEGLYNRLGIFSIRDLINYFPRDYFIYEEPVERGMLEDGRTLSVEGIIMSAPVFKRTSRGEMVIANLNSNGALIQLLWFGAPYIRASVKKNMRFVMHGRLEIRSGRYIMIHPKVFSPEDYEKIKNRMLPVYRLTKGLTNKLITENIRQALTIFQESEEYKAECLPFQLSEKNHLIPYGAALCALHFPADKETFAKARRRFAFEELFFFQYSLKKLQEERPESLNHYRIDDFSLCEEWMNSLPYEPTNDQKKAILAVRKDFGSKHVMQRVIQGDVGSGKTLVAFYAALAAAANGYQAAVMAPTEVLAKQHFATFTKWCEALSRPIECILLTGSLKAKERKQANAAISSGDAKIIVGTHAVIQDTVVFKDLALVVVDEQHRFGVHQRAMLTEKGIAVHSIFMTATPIPRTLAILLYGSTDISEIIEKPAQRLPVKNCMIPFSQRKTAFNFILKEIKNGHQAFIICPMIEENEMFACENINDYQKQVRDFFKSEARVDVLHGKMTAAKKEEVMEKFAAKETDILIATTVIEVGIDIPNATVMMIENAERFGLSQLHQLRGRVGRGKDQSYCIFVNASDSPESNERLEVLVKSNDGFYIANEDLRLRGPGDLFGIRQSGEMDFVFADIYHDSDILRSAKAAAEEACRGGLSEEDRARVADGLVKYGNNGIGCV